MSGTVRDLRVVRIHREISLTVTSARRRAALSSSSMSDCNSACSSSTRLPPLSRAVLQRDINSSSRCCCAAVKNASGRRFWITTSNTGFVVAQLGRQRIELRPPTFLPILSLPQARDRSSPPRQAFLEVLLLRSWSNLLKSVSDLKDHRQPF